MQIRELNADPRSMAELLETVARARGCSGAAEVEEFLAPEPPLTHALERFEAYRRCRERIRSALGLGQRIVLFGDYDADGITSLVQMHRFLRAAGHPDRETRWFVPDRQRHDYGLTEVASEECLRLHAPQLVIALDCGTTAAGPIASLRARGIDCLVIDHHALEGPAAEHPAAALLNPAAWDAGDGAAETLRRCSASGLTFLACERLAADLGVESWDRRAGLLLAGLGTVVDVMPLVGANRALVKQALRVAAAEGPARVPGLAALHETTGAAAIDARTFGFLWGPRLNAPGRLEDAAHPVDLLLAPDVETARPLAERCHESNRQRQELTRGMEEEARRLAEERLRLSPEETVLVLGERSWHPGIVGIVAGRLRERFHRPVVVCGGHASGVWKGSGRSVDGYDLGAEIRAAAGEGVVLGGGGHALAAGLQLDPGQLEPLRAWLNARSPLRPGDLVGRHEVLCPVAPARLAEWAAAPGGDPRRDSSRLARFWMGLYDRLEPFGAGNPKPGLALRGAELRWGPEPRRRKSDGTTWALAGGFALSGESGLLFAEWADPPRAADLWTRGGRYDLILAPTRSAAKGKGSPEKIWHGWRVLDADRA